MDLEKEHLTIQEGFLAMVFYLKELQQMTNSEDLSEFLSFMQFLVDGDTADPAVWYDWLDAVKKVKSTPIEKLIEENTIKFS